MQSVPTISWDKKTDQRKFLGRHVKSAYRSQVLWMLCQMQEFWRAHSHFRGSGQNKGSPGMYGNPLPEHLGRLSLWRVQFWTTTELNWELTEIWLWKRSSFTISVCPPTDLASLPRIGSVSCPKSLHTLEHKQWKWMGNKSKWMTHLDQL